MAHDCDLLTSNHVTHILNVSTIKMVDFPNRFVYKHVPMTDLPNTDILSLLDECFSFIDDGRKSGGKVFVHCMAGVSRSASIVIAYIMRTKHMSFKSAFDFVKERRPCICPNDGFHKQLQLYEQQLNLSEKNSDDNRKH